MFEAVIEWTVVAVVLTVLFGHFILEVFLVADILAKITGAEPTLLILGAALKIVLVVAYFKHIK